MAKIIITCEHGGNQIPSRYRTLFANHQQLLSSHFGWDIGALQLAKNLALEFANDFFYSRVSRLLVELNRSLHNPRLFSFITKSLPKEEKHRILDKYYFPYRSEVEQTINRLVKHHFVLHISVHTFTPVINNQQRHADVGLLYDPERKNERHFCRQFRSEMLNDKPKFKTRLNYPYLGKSDGFVTYLRKKFPQHQYAGVELEVNQKYFLEEKSSYLYLKEALIQSFYECVNGLCHPSLRSG